ncbi:hypothetical protein OSB04_006757 [Centaurea solstitialis]|uniref:Transmembrane protein n=1 Tax=Centaurea solstitialis TaxID=347529 RepID=A0AA38U1S7_9ASTR|nr:hypothetical protein OSB04_006757 [Centaurea solstitialis]
MITSLNLRRISSPALNSGNGQHFSGNSITLSPPKLRLHNRWCLASISTNSSNSSEPTLSSSIGAPPPSLSPISQWNLTHRHILLLNFIACSVTFSISFITNLIIYFLCLAKFSLQAAISATWLFCSAIPTLLAFKRAAESLEKLLDVTREELPDTMAAVRLSGMEISDLTMELSDLGQEITQGVKSSTRAVRLAEERLRRLTNMNPSASMQMVVPMKSEPAAGPAVARSARGIRETIVKSRAFMQMFFTITQFSKVAFKYLKSRAKSNS